MKKIFLIILLIQTVVLGFVFIYWTNLALAAASQSAPGPIRFYYPPGGNEDLTSLVKSIAGWLRRLAFPVAVVMIIYAGALLLFNQGNETMIKRGKATLKYALIGLAIILIGSGFYTLIKSILELGK